MKNESNFGAIQIFISNIAIAILNFSLLLLVKLWLLISFASVMWYWFFASFLDCSFYSYRSSYYRDNNSCCSFRLLRVLVKSNCNLFSFASKSKKEQQLSLSVIVRRAITSERALKKTSKEQLIQ